MVTDQSIGWKHYGPWVALLFSLAACAFVPVAVFVLEWGSFAFIVRLTGTCFAVASFILTAMLIVQHIRAALSLFLCSSAGEPIVGGRWNSKFLYLLRSERYVLRLISLVPAYSLFALIALWTAGHGWDVATTHLTDCYEAFITLTFFAWMLNETTLRFPSSKSSSTLSSNGSGDDEEGVKICALVDGNGDDTPVGGKALHLGSTELHRCGWRKLREHWTSLVDELQTRLTASNRSDLSWRKRVVRFVCSKLRGRDYVPSFCRLFLALYLVVNWVLLVLAVICDRLGIYQEGELSFQTTYFYIYVSRLLFLTPTLAGLVAVLVTLRRPLVDASPVKKFATVKLIVFIGVWQRFDLTVLRRCGKLPLDVPPAEGLVLIDSALTCVEMFVASFVNIRVFPPMELPELQLPLQPVPSLDDEGTERQGLLLVNPGGIGGAEPILSTKGCERTIRCSRSDLLLFFFSLRDVFFDEIIDVLSYLCRGESSRRGVL